MIDQHIAEDLAAMRRHAFMAEARPHCAYFRGVGICSFGCIHAPGGWWLGPACNFGNDPAVKLIVGQEAEAEAVTCWRCRHPAEAASMEADWAAKWDRWALRGAR